MPELPKKIETALEKVEDGLDWAGEHKTELVVGTTSVMGLLGAVYAGVRLRNASTRQSVADVVRQAISLDQEDLNGDDTQAL